MVVRFDSFSMPESFTIREASAGDLDSIVSVERAAFGQEDEADLVRSLLADPTAEPTLSLVADVDGRIAGHVLFSAVQVEGAQPEVVASILAPLAIDPAHQRQGIGLELMRIGLETLRARGCDLVFVLGHPAYYPRAGFEPAGRLGLSAPYPIAEKNANAWMVVALKPGLLGNVQGTVRCAKALDTEEAWVE